MNKKCTKCKEVKKLEDFNNKSASKDGKQIYCRECENYLSREQYKKHKERKDKQNRAWYEANKEKRKITQAELAKNNKEKRAIHYEKYRKSHMSKDNAKSMKRYIMKKQSTPLWANEFFIKEIYDLARLRSKITGIKWQVDHIIPLRGKNVSGLHVETNLRVIPRHENLRKSNKFNI